MRLFIYDKVYETPDGENCITKVGAASAVSTYIGFVMGGLDLIGRSKPQTLATGVTRLGSFLIPAAAMGAAYSATTCVAAKITKRDHGINHFFGGCAAGAILGARVRSMKAGTGLAVVFGIAGFMAKMAYVENVTFIPRAADIPFPDQGSFFHYNRSFDPWKKEPRLKPQD